MIWPLWLFLGAAFGAFQTFSQSWTVNSLRADTPLAGVVQIFGRAALGWLLACILLVLALSEGIFPGLLVFTGLILARWLALIYQNRS